MASTTGIGGRIQAVRKERGWTQEALAEAVGVTRSAVAQWETDRAGQITDNLARIAAALGTDVEWLMHGREKFAAASSVSGDELALLRLYRECTPEDRQILLRMARRFVSRDNT